MLTIKDPCSDIFSDLRETNDEQKAYINQLRIKANDLLFLFDALPNCRRKAIAVTKLEEAILFATKAACYGS